MHIRLWFLPFSPVLENLVLRMTSYLVTSWKIYEWMLQSNDVHGTYMNECVNSYATIKIKCFHNCKHLTHLFHFYKWYASLKKKKLSLVTDLDGNFQLSGDCGIVPVLRKQSPLRPENPICTSYKWRFLFSWQKKLINSITLPYLL